MACTGSIRGSQLNQSCPSRSVALAAKGSRRRAHNKIRQDLATFVMDAPDTDTLELYATLNVSREATLEEITKAYRRLAGVFHPDKHADEEKRKQAQEAFSRLQEAYEVLGDQQKRAIYDGPWREDLPISHHVCALSPCVLLCAVYGRQGLAAGRSRLPGVLLGVIRLRAHRAESLRSRGWGPSEGS